MSGRVCLGWRVLSDEWDAFLAFVEETWGSTEGYLRFEVESAMREFLDEDSELHEAEQLLRDWADARELSSSSLAASGISLKGDTTKLGHRVQQDLKDDFAGYAKERYDANLGVVLSRALNEYRGGGRGQRIRDLVHQITTGGIAGDTTAGSDENTRVQQSLRDTTSATDESQSRASAASDERQRDTSAESDERPLVDAMTVSKIASALEEPVYEDDIHREIAKRLGGDGETIQTYTEAVTEYESLVEHPLKDGLYIPESARKNITIYDDLNRAERTERLREMLCAEALRDRANTRGIGYSDVQDLFEEELSGAPSYDYAYTLMELAAEEHGFEAINAPYPSELRVTVAEVPDRYIEDAECYDGVDTDLVATLTDPGTFVKSELATDQPEDQELTQYPGMTSPGQQEAGADD